MAAAAGVICPEPTCCLVDDECEELLTVRFAEEPLSQTTIKAATALCHKHVLGVLEQAVAQLRSGIAVIVPTLEGERVTALQVSASKHDGSPQWQFLMHGDTPGATGDLITIPGSAFSHVELEPIGDEGELAAPDGVWATVVWLERRLQAIAIVAGATRGMLASQQQDLARRSLAACPPQNLPARKRRSLPQAQQLVALAQARRLASHTRLTLARALLQGHVQALCSACTCSSSGLEWLAAVETLESQAAATLASRVGPSTLADVLASSLQCLLPVRIVRSPLQPSE